MDSDANWPQSAQSSGDSKFPSSYDHNNTPATTTAMVMHLEQHRLMMSYDNAVSMPVFPTRIKLEPSDSYSNMTESQHDVYGSMQMVKMVGSSDNTPMPTEQQKKNVRKCVVCQRGFGLKVFFQRHAKSHNKVCVSNRKSSQSSQVKKVKTSVMNRKHHNGTAKLRFQSLALRKLFRSGHLKSQSKSKMGLMSSNSSCFVCQKWFSHKAVFKLHMLKHHSIGTKSDLFSAASTSTIASTYSNPWTIEASTSSSGNNTFDAINQYHTGSGTMKEKKYKCTLCDKRFTQSGKLSFHMRKHTGERPYSCSVCGKDFALKDHLNIHVKIHTGEKPYPCTMCDKTFRQGGHLRMHMQTHTGIRPHQCELCDKSFSQRGSLISHMRMHLGQKLQHQCTMCDKSFRDSTKLNNHVRTHTGEKPFACSLCDKAFTQSGDLVRHMRIHTGEKPYVCKVCDKQFSEGSNLNKHMRTHTGYRPHECSICHKAFTEGSTLKNHMRIHSGEKPYQCSVCLKEFIQSGDLYKHMRTHTGEKPHNCPVCNRAFTESSTLRKHMKTHRDKEGGEKGVGKEG